MSRVQRSTFRGSLFFLGLAWRRTFLFCIVCGGECLVLSFLRFSPRSVCPWCNKPKNDSNGPPDFPQPEFRPPPPPSPPTLFMWARACMHDINPQNGKKKKKADKDFVTLLDQSRLETFFETLQKLFTSFHFLSRRHRHRHLDDIHALMKTCCRWIDGPAFAKMPKSFQLY